MLSLSKISPNTLLVFFMCFLHTGIFSQQANCHQIFEFISNHIESNYPGFKDKIEDSNLEGDQKFKEKILLRLKHKVDEKCIASLQRYIEFFKDEHIQLFKNNQPVANSSNNIEYDSFEFKSLNKNTSYIKIPSFNQRISRRIDSLMMLYSKSNPRKPYLILDLRGNEGGVTFTFEPLLPLLGIEEIHYIGFDVFSTRTNRKAYMRLMESSYYPESQKPYLKAIIDSMQVSPNQLIPLSPDYIRQFRVDEYPKSMVILIDTKCGSATEHFLFAAQQSERVTLMGNATRGVYDYGDMREFPIPNSTFQLWCATTRSRRLNDGNGIDHVGIQPEIALDNYEDWLKTALNFLKSK